METKSADVQTPSPTPNDSAKANPESKPKATNTRKPRNNKKAGQSKEDQPAAQADQIAQQDRPKRSSRSKKGERGGTEGQESPKQRNFKNVFGDAILEPEQISDTLIDRAEDSFLEPQALLEKVQSKSHWAKQLRMHERVCELDDKYSIVDFSLRSKSRHCKDIDNAYFQGRNDLSTWMNVRDGNSLLLEHNAEEDNRLQSVQFLRQGLPRFFNLTADAVGEEKHSQLPRDPEQAYQQYDTLAQVRKALMEGAKVEVSRSLKTNGDSACITWSSEMNAWVITSQNVSILARTEKDIKTLYPEQTRYFLARKIALCWIRKVKEIERAGHGRLAQLQSELSECVFVGDFIGNADLINLIKYPRETICFHSVVKKQRVTACARDTLYCEIDSVNIIKRFNLDVVPQRVCGIYESYDELCSSLLQIHKQVTNSALSASEEGAVLTFIRRNSDSSKADAVISMCKVKSVEYQALRLLVDLLQGAVEEENLERAQDSLFTQFVKEFKVFSRNIDPAFDSHPETFYFDLFSNAYTMLAKKNAKDKEMYQNMLFSDTVKFMALVLNSNEEKNNGKRYVGQIELESQILSDLAPQPDESRHPASQAKLSSAASSKKVTPSGESKSQGKSQKVEESEPKQKDRKSKNVRASSKSNQSAAQAEEVAPKAVRVPTSMPSITALVVPPYSLTKALMQSIKETYQVLETTQLDVNAVEAALKKKSSKRLLVVLSSLDGITEQSQLCNLKLYAYRCSETFKSQPANNFYLDASLFYAHNSFQDATSAALVRKEAEKMIKVANSAKLIKLVNPARMHLNNEEELMVVLQLQEPPSCNVSVINSDEEDLKVEKPSQSEPVKQAEQAPPKKKKKTKTAAAKPVSKVEAPEEQLTVVGKQAQIVIVFPIGIPGMGKTHFAENIMRSVFAEQLDLKTEQNLHVIHFDEVRKECLDQWMKEHPRKSLSDGLKATAKQSINLFRDLLNSNLTKMAKTDTDDLQMIYLDRNQLPAEITATLESINEVSKSLNANIRRVALVPTMEPSNQLRDFPFSTSFLLQCYIRCLERDGHLTISNEDPQRLATILIAFSKQFKNTKFDSSFMTEFGFDNLIRARFTMEHEDLELPPKLDQALQQALTGPEAQIEQQCSQICRLVDLYRSLFNGNYENQHVQENTDQMKKSLNAFEKEHAKLLAKQQKEAEQARKQQSQQQPSKNQATSFSVDETIEERLHEESEDSVEQVKKPKQSQKKAPRKENKPEPLKSKAIEANADEFQVQQSRPSKKKQVSAAAATPQPVKMAQPITPRAHKPLAADFNEEFETVGAKKSRFADSDEESDDIRVPKTLSIKLSPNRQQMNDVLAQAFKQIPEDSCSSTIKANVSSILKLLSNKSLTMSGGWEHCEPLSLTCMNVGRDQDTFEANSWAMEFQSDRSVVVTCSAILLLPGKAVVGIASLEDQEVDDRVPHLQLLINDYSFKAQLSSVVRTACTRGPFSSTIQTLKTGGKVPENKRFTSGAVSMGRDSQLLTAYLVVLEEPLDISGQTHIQY